MNTVIVSHAVYKDLDYIYIERKEQKQKEKILISNVKRKKYNDLDYIYIYKRENWIM